MNSRSARRAEQRLLKPRERHSLDETAHMRMDRKDTFDCIASSLSNKVNVQVDWAKQPSRWKLYDANVALLVIEILLQKSTMVGPPGTDKPTLLLKNFARKLFEGKDRKLNLVGKKPAIASFTIDQSHYDLHFNDRLWKSLRTGFTDYCPCATLAVVNTDRTWYALDSSPFSWGADIQDYYANFDATLIIETRLDGYLSKRLKRHFKGFKYIECPYKYFLSFYQMYAADKRLAQNNGFLILENVNNVNEARGLLNDLVASYLNDMCQDTQSS